MADDRRRLRRLPTQRETGDERRERPFEPAQVVGDHDGAVAVVEPLVERRPHDDQVVFAADDEAGAVARLGASDPGEATPVREAVGGRSSCRRRSARRRRRRRSREGTASLRRTRSRGPSSSRAPGACGRRAERMSLPRGVVATMYDSDELGPRSRRSNARQRTTKSRSRKPAGSWRMSRFMAASAARRRGRSRRPTIPRARVGSPRKSFTRVISVVNYLP